jgi:hypothetical protein
VLIVEWARERFDETTARWCFDRLPEQSADPGSLAQRRDQWRESGQPWAAYCRSWAEQEGLHAGQDIVRELDARFDCQQLAYGPYFFADLASMRENDERAAIAAGDIRPTASNTSAEGDKAIGRSRSPDGQCRAGPPPASSRWAGGLSFHRDPPFQHQHRFLYGPQPKLIPLAPCTFPGWSCASRLRGAGQRFWWHDWIWADQWLRWFAVSRANAASTSPACRFSGRVSRMGVRCDGADSVTWGSGWASFQDC